MFATVRRIAVLALLALATITAFALTPSTAHAAPVPTTTLEAQVVTLINNIRVQNRCTALRVDTRLVTAARRHSADMIAQNYFSHTGKNGSTFITRAKAAGYTTPSGENIAWGYRTAAEVVNAWMNSTAHKRNILNCASKATGVGAARKADGSVYWTQLFGTV